MSGFYDSAKVTPRVHQNQDFALSLIQATLPVQELSKAFSHLTFPSVKTCLSGSQLPPRAGMNSGSDATGHWGCKGEAASPCIMTQYLQNVLGDVQVPSGRALRFSVRRAGESSVLVAAAASGICAMGRHWGAEQETEEDAVGLAGAGSRWDCWAPS